MKKLILAVLVACAAFVATADSAQAKATGAKVNVTQFVAYADGSVYIVFSGGICDEVGTSASWGQASQAVGATPEGVRNILATATAAKLSGRPVTVETKDCAPSSRGCVITSINMY